MSNDAQVQSQLEDVAEIVDEMIEKALKTPPDYGWTMSDLVSRISRKHGDTRGEMAREDILQRGGLE